MSYENSGDLFTGERFIPGINDSQLELEHFQRYYSILEFVKDKVVLDAACGEGYGSNILASSASKVTGIDIDQEAISNARKKYSEKNKIEFKVESVAELSLPSDSVDVVVSFETIEHISEELQYQFLEQIERVLKPDGILIMSTPNKEIYSDLYDYHNEFHVKEFYKQEFENFLLSKFKHIRFYHQYFEVASIIDLPGEVNEKVAYQKKKDYNTDGKYFIAIAGNASLPKINISHVFMNMYPEYRQRIDRIISLQNEVVERNNHLIKLDEEIAKNRNLIQELYEEKGNYDNILKQNNEKLSNEEQKNLKLIQNNNELHEWIARLKEKINDYTSKNAKLQEEVSSYVDENAQLQEKINSYISKCTDLQSKNDGYKNKVLELEKEINNYENQIQTLNQTVLNKEGHIEQLLEVEREYRREQNSRTYKLALNFRKISVFFLPQNSKRRFFASLVIKGIRHPRLMLHVLNFRRIKNFFDIVKKEGMESVNNHYRLVEEVEKSRLNPFDANQYEVVDNDPKDIKTIEDYEKITFEKVVAPKVSIIIPVYNQFDYTYNCLNAIKKQSFNVTYEIIIADDCSTDLTSQITDVIHGVQVIHNSQNMRFLKNCNNAAEQAKGEYIVFLNNDTQVQKNWLKPLVDILDNDSQIGMTGSKLVYENGWLQEAGGIFWSDASAWNYGNKKNPDDPEFNYVKEADYISGAAIMIRKSLWDEIGGFDEHFAPAYYEDSDLAFEVRKHGYKVVYQPLSVVIHFEGISNGTDISSGQKAYQVENQKKFYEKWKTILEKEHFPNGENVFLAKDRSRFKKQILVVDHYVPHYDKDAGGKCTYMYLLLFVKMGFKVTFIGDNFYKHEPYTTDLNQHGIEVLYGNYYYNNWQDWLKENLHYFDYVYLQRPHISIKYIDIIKQYSHAKILYFAHDLHHVREYREYLLTNDEEKLKSSEHWKEIEYELFEKADVGHVVGTYEQDVMQKAFPNKPIRNIPLYVYEDILGDINKNFEQRKDLIYVGGFGHPPNIDAVLWFGKEVFPKVLQVYPDLVWHVVGGSVPIEVQELASDNIRIEGFLSDEKLHELYRTCRMAVVPLRVGAGVKGKVVEAAYYQIPLVTTSIGAEGLSSEEGNMIVEDDADKMAELIAELYKDYKSLQKMSDAGITFIQNYFTEAEAERVLLLDIKND